jgi:hypothetical protein
MKSLVRKLLGSKIRRAPAGPRPPVRLGLEALEERAVPAGTWVGGAAGDTMNAENANNWAERVVPGNDVGVYFGDPSVTTNADCVISQNHTWCIVTRSNWSGHTLTLGTGSGGVNVIENGNAGVTPDHRYGTIKVTNGSRLGVATPANWDGGDFATDSSSQAGIYISNTLQVRSVTGTGGTNPGALDGITVYVGEDVAGNVQPGFMKFGGSGANWLDSNATVKNAAEIITEQKSDGSVYGTLEFDNVGSATIKGGIRLSGTTLSVIANDGQFKRVGGDTSGNLEIDCQLWQRSGRGSAQLTRIGYNSGVYFKYGSSGMTSAADFEGGACFVGSGATLEGDNQITFATTNLIFTSPAYDGQTENANYSHNLNADLGNVSISSSCNVYTGVSSWTSNTTWSHGTYFDTVNMTSDMVANGSTFFMSIDGTTNGNCDSFDCNSLTLGNTSACTLTMTTQGSGFQSGAAYTLFLYRNGGVGAGSTDFSNAPPTGFSDNWTPNPNIVKYQVTKN